MTDQELLRLAAKMMQATGDQRFTNYTVGISDVVLELGTRRGAVTRSWDPITRPSDAFLLAIKLNEFEPYKSHGGFRLSPGLSVNEVCLSVVCAAAEIGKTV